MEETIWMQNVGLAPSLGAKLSYTIIAGGDTFCKCPEEKIKKNEELVHILTEKREECENVYKTWRFPDSYLDLIQLAVVCNNSMAVRHLMTEIALRVFRYGFIEWKPIAGSQPGVVPTNNPVHLACFLGHREVLLEIQHRCHLPTEVGEVTVTAYDSKCSPYSPAVPLLSPIRGTPMGLAVATGNVYHNVGLIKDYALSLNFKTALTAQDIQGLWRVLDVVYAHATSETAKVFCGNCSKCPNLFPDFLLLSCQLFRAGRWSMVGSCLLECTPLAFILESVVHQKRPDLLPLVAAYCSREQLSVVLTYLQDRKDPQPHPRSSYSHLREFLPLSKEFYHQRDAIISAFQQEQKERTLQDETVLAILSSVGGNPRQVQGLDRLPRPLLNLFEMPFQDLHEQQLSLKVA